MAGQMPVVCLLAAGRFILKRDLAFFWRFGRLGFWGDDGRTDDLTGLPPDPLLRTENRQFLSPFILAI